MLEPGPEQVDDVDLPCREQIGDQPSVAAPGERLGAHEAWALSAERVREGRCHSLEDIHAA